MIRGKFVSIYAIAGAVILTALVCTRPANAEHFNIVIQAESGNDKIATTSTDTTPPIGGVNPRPVLKVKSGASVKITWTMASGFPHGTMKKVGVHFFVVRQQSLGQKPVPDPAGPGGVIDNFFSMDFAPSAAANGSVTFKAPDPGFYLVRVQSEDTHVEHGHEHFSALDLNIE
jgi:hypothetical protein